jgi:hypothetical protein
MQTHRLIETFYWRERDRAEVTLGTGMRLHPERHILIPDGPPYPAAAEARTRVWAPESAKAWLSFQAQTTNRRANGGPVVTAVLFRLGDGTTEQYWDGATWSPATTDAHWNTEAEISEHIASFPVTERKLQIAVRMTTTDTTVAAQCTSLKVLWRTAVHFLEDILYRSLVPYLKANVRPISDYYVKPGAETATIDLNDFPLRTPYNVVGIDSVFDLTDDPNQLADLYFSYDPGTQIITLTAPLPLDHLALIRFVYEPEVAVTTSPEYNELAKVPALQLENVALVDAAQTGQEDWVVARHDNGAVLVPPPIQGDLDVTLDAVADKAIDMHRMVEAAKSALTNNPTVHSNALDRTYTLWLIDEYDMRTGPASVELHTGRLRFRVRDVSVHVRDSVDKFGVTQFRMTGTEDFVLA